MKITLFTGKTYKIEDAFDFDLKVIKSARAKRLTLRIDSKEHLPVLTIPSRCSAQRAIDFVEAHRGWIDSCMKKIPVSKKFEDGEEISLFGEKLIIKHAPELRRGVYAENGILFVSGDKEFLHRRVKDYIKKQAKTVFYKQSKVLADKLGCTLNDVTIKDTKSRWGSCSSINNINYSWRIALAPKVVFEYLIAHEVSHLKHQDHSANFWKCVEKLYPDAEEGKNWLKKHSKELYLYE